ncbi:glycerophosphodiester phosphodiesterase family protein [Streptomyces sp. NPDC059761]|uniref:glycerophosphodiester phosphodiesterase family protein n=1 Tax=Streptomyces sp. NPDC059761 TaxID=3346937 RepID=UPI00364A42E7
MPFTMIPVTRTYLNGSTPRTGNVRLELVGPLYNDSEIADCQPQVATLDGLGKIAVSVRATNDPGTLPPGGGTIKVTENLSGLTPLTYYIAAPYNGGPIDLATAPKLTEPAAAAQMFQAVNQRGLPGGYPTLDGSGRIPHAQLPPDLGSGGGGGGGGVEISGAATDIQPLGTRSAGSSGKAADASHVHAIPRLDQVSPPAAAVNANNQRLTNLANGVAPQDAATVAQLGQSVLGWLNVKDKDYGAKGDGTTNDTAAIQAALSACVPGGIVHLPQGIYRTSAPLAIPPGVTLQGSHANMEGGLNLSDPACYIQPLASFTGTSLVEFKHQAAGGYPTLSSEQRLCDVMLDGSTLNGTTPVNGISATGNVQNVVLRNVTIRKMSSNGIITSGLSNDFPYAWRLDSVVVDNCRSNGMVLNRMTDLTMIGCQVVGCWGEGFVLSNIANSQILACRAELNGNHGYHLTGAWGNGSGSGGLVMSGCTTDRNGWDGVRIDATGSAPITISGLMTRRDGRNGGSGAGSYAGLAVAAATVPIVVDGITCYPGVDDDGTGASSPQYGIRLTGPARIQVGSGYLHAVTDGFRDESVGGSVAVGAEVTTLTGPTTTASVPSRRFTRETVYTINDLLGSNPFFVAHRGGGMESPEHTMLAYETAVANGLKAIEVSVNITADGTPVCIHDPTLDRTTNKTGDLIDWTFPAARNLIKTSAKPLLGTNWEEQPLTTLRSVLDRFVGRCVIFIEPKTNAAQPVVQQMLNDHFSHAYRSLVWKQHYLATGFGWAKARNIRSWAYLDAGTTDAQIDAMPTAPDMLGVPHTMSNTRISQIVARGLPVICWEVHRRSDVTRLTGLGVQGMMCAQPQYVLRSTPIGPATDWATGVKAPGDMGTALYNNNRALQFDPTDGSVYFNTTGAAALIGSRSLTSFPAAGYRVSFEMKYEAVPLATEHAGIAVGKVADDAYQFGTANASGGYHTLLRGNGDLQLFSHTAGVTSGTQLGTTQPTTPPVANTWMTFEVDVTPTQVIVRRTDVEPDVQVVSGNTDYRGGYVHITAGSVSSLTNRPRWRNFRVDPL